MARMYPPHPSERTTSSAEIRVFDWIRDDLPDDWRALHSLGLKSHRRKPWAEIDFVLIGPPGIFCLEIKGGRVSRGDGVWRFTDRNNVVSTKSEGPFDQVAGAAGALRQYMLKRLPGTRNLVVGYGVMMPDIEFNQNGPDILQEVLFDKRDLGKFDSYLTRLTDYWRSRFSWTADSSQSMIREIVDEFRGDFEFIPPLGSVVSDIDNELGRLTNEQFKVLDLLSENPRVVVRGGAGTGKTVLAAEEARRQSNNGRRVLFCCFNRNLGAYLRVAMKDAENVFVWHLHGFMEDAISRAGDKSNVPPELDPTDLFEVIYPSMCCDAIKKLHEHGCFDVLIVDEGQDLLMPKYLDVFDLVLDGGLKGGEWRIFLDSNQDIFGNTSSLAQDRIAAIGPALARLTLNCRNTAPIAVATSLLSGISSEETLLDLGPDVEYHWFSCEADGARAVSDSIDQLISNGLKIDQISILSGRRFERSCISKIRRLDIESWEGPATKSGVIRFSTIGAFKGLESDVVLLTDVADLTDIQTRSALYVGTSRAKAILQVFIDRKFEGEYRQKAIEYGRNLATSIQ